MIKRFENNPIIQPAEIEPILDNSEIIGAFNAGVAYHDDEFILLLRIAERPISSGKNVDTWEIVEGELERKSFNSEDRSLNFEDPRTIRAASDLDGFVALTSMSYLRIARSKNGKDFTVDDDYFMFPDGEENSLGIEDARITKIEDAYYITYTQVSRYGVSVGLSKTLDFKSHDYLGTILAPENKDVVIFPEKVKGKYYMLHRPSLKSIGGLNIWLAESDNLRQWGNHKYLIGTRENSYNQERIGAGGPPIKTSEGWLALYHGAANNHVYSTGAFLLDLDDPSKVIGRTTTPIFEPEMEYEQKGFFGDVVFITGAVEKDEELYVYYGASDTVMAGGVIQTQDILEQIERES